MSGARCLGLAFAILIMVSAFLSSPLPATMPQTPHLYPLADPLGHFEGNGPPTQISWTGDGQVITNPSFETGVLTPWIATSYNAGNKSSVQVTSPGYADIESARIALYSANLSIGSNYNLEYDLSNGQAGFNSAVRFRAAVFVQSMTGVTALDKVEVAVTLSTSTGALRTIHYIFDGPTISPKTVIYDRVNNGNYTSSDLLISGTAPPPPSTSYVITFLSVDSKVKFVNSPPATSPNATGTWSPPETVIYDADGSGTYSSGDLVIAGTPPAIGTNLSVDPKIKFVDTPPAKFPNSPGTVVLGNTASDIYIQVPRAGLTGQWLTIDRNLAADASAFSDSSILDSVQQLRLSSMAQSFAKPNHDPHIKYVNPTNLNVWSLGDTLVYDADVNGVYDSGIDTVLAGTAPSNGTPLKDDPLIRYVDTDGNGVWDAGEPIVYDANNSGLVTFADPSLYGTTKAGTPLVTRVTETTSALFDQIELYSASGNSDWIRNGGFETGLAGWSYTSASATLPDFASSNAHVLAGSSGAVGTVTNRMGEMVQSIDALPQIDTSTLFKASAYISKMNGTSNTDFVDVWLGLFDSQRSPVSVYYSFKTGDGSLPANRTDATYHKAPSFGNLNQWLSLSVPLYQEEARFNMLGLGYTPPYSVELVVIEVGAASSPSTTTAYFDQLSILKPGYSGSATSYFYANNGVNSTYVYSASGIPQGSLSYQVPLSEQVLNVTAPDGTAIPKGAYSVQPATTFSTVTVQPTAFFGHPPVGTWKLYTSSTNTAASLYAQDPGTLAALTTVQTGTTVNLASQSKDPLGNPLSGASVTLTLWSPSGVLAATWAGNTNSQGWWNATGVALPPTGGPAGTYTLQAAVSSLAGYVGVKTVQLPVRSLVILSLAVSSGSISQGTPVTISGFATSQSTGAPLQGVNVTLSYREAGSGAWIPFVAVTSDATGKYSYNWTPPQGLYEVMASVGDSQTQPAQSPQSQITVGPSTNQPGSNFLLWLLIGIAAASVGLILAFFLFFRKKRNATSSPSSEPVSNPKKGTSSGQNVEATNRPE